MLDQTTALRFTSAFLGLWNHSGQILPAENLAAGTGQSKTVPAVKTWFGRSVAARLAPLANKTLSRATAPLSRWIALSWMLADEMGFCWSRAYLYLSSAAILADEQRGRSVGLGTNVDEDFPSIELIDEWVLVSFRFRYGGGLARVGRQLLTHLPS
jgi:hypothetical protein